MSANGRCGNRSFSDAARNCADAPLCAASSTSSGDRRTTSRRPGQSTVRKPSRTASSGTTSPARRTHSSAASATVALSAWCSPVSAVRYTSCGLPAGPAMNVCPSRVLVPGVYSQSRPTSVSGAPTSAAISANTSSASGGCGALTTGTPALTIPPFSRAIDASESPSKYVWS